MKTSLELIHNKYGLKEKCVPFSHLLAKMATMISSRRLKVCRLDTACAALTGHNFMGNGVIVTSQTAGNASATI